MSRFLRYAVLILPIIFFWVGQKIHKVKYANDPEYIYLVNATAICDGKSVGHIDNPGTTVMQIGACTIALKHLFSNPDHQHLVEHVFSEPDQFVFAIRFVFLFLNTLVLFFLGWFALKKTGSVWIAIFLQLTPFISANTLDHIWTKMSPEPVLFFVTCLYVISILFFYTQKEKNVWKFVIIFALLAGAGLGTKATFLPLVIFPLFVLPKWKKKVFYLLGTIPSFVLFTIPAIPEYKNMYFWFRRLISHSGKYGHGSQQLIDWQTYLPNIAGIIRNNPVFGLTVGTAIIAIIYLIIKKKSFRSAEIRFLAGLLATLLFGILLVAKQYNGNHYLIPVLLLTGITLFYAVVAFLKDQHAFQNITFGLLSGVLLFWILNQQLPKLREADYGYKITNEEMDSTNLMLERDFQNYTIIHYYPSSLNKYSALNFGDVYTNRKMLPQLKKMYPKTYFYDFFFNLMQYWNAETFLEDVVEFNDNKILLTGGPRDESMLLELEKRGLPFRKIYKGRIQAIYELDSVRFKEINQRKVVLKEITCNAENLTADGKLFTDTLGHTYGNSWCRTNEQARSGSYSIKMDENTEFALEYTLDSLKAGDCYEISVWRKSDNYSGRLIVGSTKPKVFYKAQNDFITSDKGWDMLRIKFTVSENMVNEAVKIYLWNKDKQTAYFDDLSVKRIAYKSFNAEIREE